LQSETATSFDIGYRHRLTRIPGKFELALYRNDYKNLIDFDPILFTSVNRTAVVTQGFEAAISLELFDTLSIKGHATYTDSEIKDSTARLRGRPNWRIGATIEWTINPDWRLVGSILTLDEFWEVSIPTGGLFLDGYNRLDLALRYNATEKLKLGLAIDNLLDESYQEAVGFPGQGVRGRINARYEF
jgi:outer membrane receptor protein involved in Fe transport